VLRVKVKIAENEIQGSKLREEICTTGRSSKLKVCSHDKKNMKNMGEEQRCEATNI